MKIYISGASDDLVEVDGDVQLEGGAYNGAVVSINGVDAFRVDYERDGTWAIEQIAELPGIEVTRHEPVDENQHRNHPCAPELTIRPYSEVVVLAGDIRSINCGGDEWLRGTP